MISVKANEFRYSYKNHYKLYKNVTGSVSIKSRRLLLFYSVECGLKCLILKKIGKSSSEELIQYMSNKRGGARFNGHDIREMVKEMELDREYSIKKIKLMNQGGSAEPYQFNELWRYGARCDEEDEIKVEETLQRLAEYIEKRV